MIEDSTNGGFVTQSDLPPPNASERVVTLLGGFAPNAVGHLLDQYPHLLDALEHADLHLLTKSWAWGDDHELARFRFEYDPDPEQLLAALSPGLGRRVLETILRARERGEMPAGQLDMAKMGFVGEVGYAAARVLWNHLPAIEPPADGPAHGWTRPLPVIGWLGAGEGGSWFFGANGTRLESGDWEGASGVADAWIAGAG